MKFKPYVLATKWGWFREFQPLSIIVSPHNRGFCSPENWNNSDFDEILTMCISHYILHKADSKKFSVPKPHCPHHTPPPHPPAPTPTLLPPPQTPRSPCPTPAPTPTPPLHFSFSTTLRHEGIRIVCDA